MAASPGSRERLATALPRDPAAILAALRDNPVARLASGRELVQRRAARPQTELLSTGLPSFDRLLDGGMPRGCLVELTGRRSSGRFAAVLAALAATTARGEAAALVDLGASLEPAVAADAGAMLERLLWVRPGHLKQAALGAEMLLATGFTLVILDLGSPPVPGGRGPEAVWLRLARAAASHGAALLVSSPYRVSGTAAAAVLEIARGHPVWRGRGRSPRLLAGLRARMTLEKWLPGQGWRPGEELRLRRVAAPGNGPRAAPPPPPSNPGRRRGRNVA